MAKAAGKKLMGPYHCPTAMLMRRAVSSMRGDCSMVKAIGFLLSYY
jgi:hypothetical protein